MKILLAHPEPSESRPLEKLLSAHGYGVDAARTGAQTLSRAREDSYDLLVLAHELAGTGVSRTCEMLRNGGINTPILVLGAPDIPEIVAALDAGADSCIVRPFTFDEFLAQVRAVLRRRSRQHRS